MLNIPYVDQGKGVYNDIFSHLLKNRIIMLNGEVNEDSAQLVISSLLYLDSIDNKTPIKLYINSPGGTCSDGLGIIDTMKCIKSPVHTITIGLAASMAAMILSQGDKRFSLPNSEILIHQPLGGISFAQCSDIQIHAKSIQDTKRKLTQMLADSSLLSYEELEEMMDRDCILSAEEALEFGIIDKIVEYTDK